MPGNRLLKKVRELAEKGVVGINAEESSLKHGIKCEGQKAQDDQVRSRKVEEESPIHSIKLQSEIGSLFSNRDLKVIIIC